MARHTTVGDVVGYLHRVTEQLGELSASDLETLNQVLMHTHSHVVHEMNGRMRRNLATLFDEEASSD